MISLNWMESLSPLPLALSSLPITAIADDDGLSRGYVSQAEMKKDVILTELPPVSDIKLKACHFIPMVELDEE